MSEARRCSACGAELPSDALLRRVCLACALGYALGEGSDDGAEDDAPLEAGAERIGPYCLRRLLGEGGMGTVWEALQEHPVRRIVALKRIKPGMDSSQVLARFESERQALALMSHPHIARVFDAGRTEEGQPYFVMEYVDGPWLTRYCDVERLALPERLDLFLSVCAAIQHAHRKGVIHRDVKPSNILVQLEDGRPVPKMIDFGVAKAMGIEGASPEPITEIGQALGTPEYMSPEQAGPAGFDVDTRTDVYSLGVVLYELLSGRIPFENVDGGAHEIRRRIQQEDPTPPSARVAALGSEALVLAQCRGTEPAALVKQLRDDLDWIVLKALAKDRGQRYGSPDELAADLRRHRARQPVLAGPPTLGYRLSKFVRRHTAGVAAASAVLLLLVTTAVGMTIQARRVARERDRANLEAKTSGATVEFLTEIFRSPDPELAQGDTVTAREVLDQGAAKIERGLSATPEVQATLMLAISRSYTNLGLYDRAEPLVRRAMELREATLGSRDPAIGEAGVELAELLRIRESLEEAEAVGREALRSLEASVGVEDARTAGANLVVGDILFDRGQYEGSEPYLRTAFEVLSRTAGPDDRQTLKAGMLLGYLLSMLGRYDEADRYLRDSVEGHRRALGDDDPNTIVTLTYLAQNSQRASKYPEAEALFREAVTSARRILGPDHPEKNRAEVNLARHLTMTGQYDEAEVLLDGALESNRRVRGARNLATLSTLAEWANLQRARGRLDVAEPAFREALDGFRETLGADHTRTMRIVEFLAILNLERGRLDEAERYSRISVENGMRIFGPEHHNALTPMVNLGHVLCKRGKNAEALQLITTALETRRRVLPTGHLSVGVTLDRYGRCLASMQRYADAEAALLEAHGIFVAAIGEEPPQTQAAVRKLIEIYDAWGKSDQAAQWREALRTPS